MREFNILYRFHKKLRFFSYLGKIAWFSFLSGIETILREALLCINVPFYLAVLYFCSP